MHIELSVCTNNETIIRALIIFSEGIFDGETLIGYSNAKPTSRIVLPFQAPKTIPYDIHLKVGLIGRLNRSIPIGLTLDLMSFQILVGFEHSQQFHVFELTRQLPRFAMLAISDTFDADHLHSEPIDFDEHTTSYVAFRLNERFQRICLWINQVRKPISYREVDWFTFENSRISCCPSTWSPTTWTKPMRFASNWPVCMTDCRWYFGSITATRWR